MGRCAMAPHGRAIPRVKGTYHEDHYFLACRAASADGHHCRAGNELAHMSALHGEDAGAEADAFHSHERRNARLYPLTLDTLNTTML